MSILVYSVLLGPVYQPWTNLEDAVTVGSGPHVKLVVFPSGHEPVTPTAELQAQHTTLVLL